MSQGKCGMTPKVGALGGGGGRKSVNVLIGVSWGDCELDCAPYFTTRDSIGIELN